MGFFLFNHKLIFLNQIIKWNDNIIIFHQRSHKHRKIKVNFDKRFPCHVVRVKKFNNYFFLPINIKIAPSAPNLLKIINICERILSNNEALFVLLKKFSV